MISEQVYEVPVKKILWCYTIWQSWFPNEKNFKFVSRLPSPEDNYDLLVLDDIMNKEKEYKKYGEERTLVPPELVSEYYQLSKPEIQLEDNISNLLKEKETPDDVNVKLLSDLIPNYQRAMKPIQSTTPFEIPLELLAESELPDEKPLEIPSKLNMMAK
ncbi:uncharacterized protein TNCV_522141 [Trichonephila clavipes]|nr:uncharacterized protein TNCV_522141 [Trichonephila clavipes]